MPLPPPTDEEVTAVLAHGVYAPHASLRPLVTRRSIRSLHSTRAQAEARLIELGVALPSRLLTPATAPPQLSLAV